MSISVAQEGDEVTAALKENTSSIILNHSLQGKPGSWKVKAMKAAECGYADDDSWIQQTNLNVTCSSRWEPGVPQQTRSRQTAGRIMRGIIGTKGSLHLDVFGFSRASEKSFFFFLQTTKMFPKLAAAHSEKKTLCTSYCDSPVPQRRLGTQTDRQTDRCLCRFIRTKICSTVESNSERKESRKISLQAATQVMPNDKKHQLGWDQIISWVKKK